MTKKSGIHRINLNRFSKWQFWFLICSKIIKQNLKAANLRRPSYFMMWLPWLQPATMYLVLLTGSYSTSLDQKRVTFNTSFKISDWYEGALTRSSCSSSSTGVSHLVILSFSTVFLLTNALQASGKFPEMTRMIHISSNDSWARLSVS